MIIIRNSVSLYPRFSSSLSRPVQLVLHRQKSIKQSETLVDLQNKDSKDVDSLITDKFSLLRDKYEAPRYPIVLCHGFSGFDKLTFIPKPKPFNSIFQQTETKVENAIREGLLQFDYWYGISEALEKLGSTVLIAKVPPFGTIQERAAHLNEFINKQCKVLRQNQSKGSIYNTNKSMSMERNISDITDVPIKVNLISHSMGGLDSRYLISKLEHTNYKVASLTTISTPHHGSECADFLVDLMKNNSLLKPLCQPCIFELTTENLTKFNKDVKDDPSVSYFSYGARFHPKWFNLFRLTWYITRHRIELSAKKQNDLTKLVDNDGIVSVESSKWGQYLGTLDQVDHLDLINWTNRTRTLFHKLLLNEEPKFNPVALYLDIADNLAKKGF